MSATMHITPRRRMSSERGDAGLSLPELIVTVSVTSILITAIAAALIATLNISSQATTQLSEAKDVSFVQTRVPIDLSSALAASDALSTADLSVDLAGQLGALGLGLPSLSGIDTLPGSNVLTIVRPNVASAGNSLIVAYRYEQRGDDWIINRYVFSPGTADPGPVVNLVATELAAPPIPTNPADLPWQPGDAIGFAANVSAQSLGNRPAGRNLELTFTSGRTFTTGGAGLSAAQSLPPADLLGLSNPLAPPSRCGKRISIIVDTSGSVPAGSGGESTELATVGFIEGFTGTPTQISLNGFDRAGYGMANDLNNPVTLGDRADFYPVLNETDDVLAMKARIEALDDTDGQWSGGKSTLDPSSPSVDPDGNGVHWDQIGSGTNWEGGLQNVYQDVNGGLYASDLPDLVVLITDGQPTYINDGPNTFVQVSADLAKEEAVDAAKELRGHGARVIGVMVGNKTGNSTYVNYLKEVAANNFEWNGKVGADSNAATAGVFLGSFSELGDILRSIVIGECGGTVTLQKRVVDADPADPPGTLTTPDSGLWRYTSNTDGDVGTRTLDRATASSVTFDYSFGPGGGTKTVRLSEEPVDGLVFVRADCGGTLIPAVVNADGVPEVVISVDADAAESCLMISEPV